MSYTARGLNSIVSAIFSIPSRIWPQCQSSQTLPKSADDVAPYAETAIPLPDQAKNVPLNHNQNDNMGFWPKLMVAFCLASAIDIAITSIQNHRLPLTLHLLSAALLFSLTFFFVSEFIDTSKFRLSIDRLRKFGVFFGATAFFIAIAIPAPMLLKCVTGFIYFIAIAVILIFNHILV